MAKPVHGKRKPSVSDFRFAHIPSPSKTQDAAELLKRRWRSLLGDLFDEKADILSRTLALRESWEAAGSLTPSQRIEWESLEAQDAGIDERIRALHSPQQRLPAKNQGEAKDHVAIELHEFLSLNKKKLGIEIRKLRVKDLEIVEGLLLDRFMPFRFEGKKTRGKPAMKRADIWLLQKADEGSERMGSLLDEVLSRRGLPTRLIYEIARLKANAKQRKQSTRRKEAIHREVRRRQQYDLAPLDDFDRERIEERFLPPDYRKSVVASLRKSGLYSHFPKTETIRRLSPGISSRERHALILILHRWKSLAFHLIRH